MQNIIESQKEQMIVAQAAVEIENSPEYLKIKENLPLYSGLYILRYVQRRTSIKLIRDELSLKTDEEVEFHLEVLGQYLLYLGNGEMRSDKLDSVCPECLLPKLTRYSRLGGEIRRVCASGTCGHEVGDDYASIEDFDTAIEHGLTYQPMSYLSWTKGLGGMLNHKKYLHTVLTNYGEDIKDVEKRSPELAAKLRVEGVAIADGVLYRLMENTIIVRHLEIDKHFHSFDKPLRKQSTDYVSKTHSEFQTVLGKATELINKFHINVEEPANQAFLQSFAIDIRELRPELKLHKMSVPVDPFVGTLLVINLYIFGKRELASIVEPEVEVHYGLVNLYGELKAFWRKHQTWDNSPDGLMATLRELSRSSNP
jgi:hypothetical protein